MSESGLFKEKREKMAMKVDLNGKN